MSYLKTLILDIAMSPLVAIPAIYLNGAFLTGYLTEKNYPQGVDKNNREQEIRLWAAAWPITTPLALMYLGGEAGKKAAGVGIWLSKKF